MKNMIGTVSFWKKIAVTVLGFEPGPTRSRRRLAINWAQFIASLRWDLMGLGSNNKSHKKSIKNQFYLSAALANQVIIDENLSEVSEYVLAMPFLTFISLFLIKAKYFKFNILMMFCWYRFLLFSVVLEMYVNFKKKLFRSE